MLLRIAADSRYVLHMNGERIGIGPARSSQTRYFFDSYDLSGRLRDGENFLAVEVHCPVTPNFKVAPVQPAVFVQVGDWLGTDASWEVRRDPAHHPDSPLFSFQMGYSEIKDLRHEVGGWKVFADGEVSGNLGWETAKILAEPHALGGRRLVERDIPPLDEREYSFRRMISGGAVPRLGDGLEYERHFADRVHGELHFHEFLPQVESRNGEIHVQPSRTGRGVFCVLDFQRGCVGNVLIEIDAPAGTILDLAYGESLKCDRVLARMSSYHMADRYILKEGLQKVECCLHDRGFRYLQLVLRRFDRAPHIHSVKILDRRYPIPVKATFQSNDDFLNRLWNMCEETISSCSLDTFVDCPWREQALWLNDTLVVFPLYLALTGDTLLPARCLKLGLDGQAANGLIPVVPPSEAEWFSNMQAIAALMLSEYYLYSGDLAFVREAMPGILRGLDIYRTWRGANELVANQESVANFIDWGYAADISELEGTTAILNLLIAAAFHRTANLLRALGDEEEATIRQRESEKIAHAVVGTMWDASREGFLDCLGSASRKPTVSQHPHAVGLFFDLLPETLQEKAVARLLDTGVVEAEFYFQYFVIGALSRSGNERDALLKIRQLWGEMVEKGSSTVWEGRRGNDSFEGCGSLCHAFSCAPLAFMQGVLLGIRPLLPGFREFAIDPHPLELERCQGSVPTPKGQIVVEWVKRGMRLDLVVQIPPGITGILRDGTRLESGSHVFSQNLIRMPDCSELEAVS